MATIARTSAKRFINTIQQISESSAHLLSLRLPFCGSRVRNRLIHYDEYLENMTEAWEFSQDQETNSKLRQLPQIMDKVAHRLPTWRDSMDFLK